MSTDRWMDKEDVKDIHNGILLSHKKKWNNATCHNNGTPLQHSCLENPTDRGAWWATVHGVSNSRTQLNDFTFTFHFGALEKEMAPHSSVLAWRIPGMGEPHGLPSVGSHRVGHDWSDLAAAAAATTWMDLEIIILSEASQKDKYHTISLIRGN